MNIALFCNSEAWGGLELNIYKLGIWLKEFNHNVVIICPENSKIFLESEKVGLSVEKIKTKFKHADFSAAFTLKKILKQHLSEAVIVAYSKDIHVTILADLLPGYHFKKIFFQQMVIGVDKKDPIHTFVYNKLDLWFAPIEWLRENTLEKTKIQKDKVHIVPLPINLDNFISYQGTKESSRKELKLPENIFLFGMIGRIERMKGQHTLIEAMNILKDKGEDIHALIVGENTYSADKSFPNLLSEMIKGYQLEDRVHFRPFMKDIRPAFKALDIYSMTSLNESFGMVTVEAMASNLPVVGYNGGATPHIVKEGFNGFIYNGDDGKELAEKILTLRNNLAQIKTIGDNARKFAQENYSHKVICQKIVSLIGSCKLK